MSIEMEETKVIEPKDKKTDNGIADSETESRIELVRKAIRDVPDFPKPGILFRDITPALADAQAFAAIIDLFVQECRKYKPTQILGIEARGFVIGGAVAAQLGIGFVPVRKPGKLPAQVFSAEYELEYGSDQVQMHRDALSSSDRVVIVDDLFATGGTALATCQLVEQAGAKIELIVCLIDLAFLPWRDKLAGQKVKSFITYND